MSLPDYVRSTSKRLGFNIKTLCQLDFTLIHRILSTQVKKQSHKTNADSMVARKVKLATAIQRVHARGGAAERTDRRTDGRIGLISLLKK